MRRLYLQIYLTAVCIMILFGILVSVAWWLSPLRQDEDRLCEGIGTTLADILPGPNRPATELQAALDRLAARLPFDLTVRSGNGELLAAVGDPLPGPDAHHPRSGMIHPSQRGAMAAFLLPDGRWLVARYLARPRSHLIVIALLAVAIAVGSYPVVRRITRRLERLQVHVDALGAGDLSARVTVEGKDEVASLARSFNHAADRIERLVHAQRSILASASHELRSPLARLRVANELQAGKDNAEIRAQIEKDIAELNELIDELLMASRMEAVHELDRTEEVDLLGLVAEEAARTDANVTGESVHIQGDPRLLRRLIRNLLENGRRYASGTTVVVTVSSLANAGACLLVSDRGPGVPEEERERIFAPFYRSPLRTERGEVGGVGLGLALVRQIARHHGGDARCHPREGGGTCFDVTLRGA